MTISGDKQYPMRRLVVWAAAWVGVASACIGPEFDPCEDTMTWDVQSGSAEDKLAWAEAMSWWEEAGARFAPAETEDGNYRVHIVAGILADKPWSGLHRPMSIPGYSNIIVDPEKFQWDRSTMVAVMAHEIGHSFGFAHVPLEHQQGGHESIMNTNRSFSQFTGVTEYDKKMFKEKCR